MHGTGIVYSRKIYQKITITSIPYSIDKTMVRESVSKIKNGTAAGLSSVVSEIVKTAGETGAEMIKDIINQIIVDRRS